MDDKTYHQECYELFLNVETQLDAHEDVMDYDKTDGKLEISFEDSPKKVVLNTQRAIHEIWLAGNAQAWHFQYDAQEKIWFARAEGVEFYQTLSQLLSAHLNASVIFKSRERS